MKMLLMYLEPLLLMKLLEGILKPLTGEFAFWNSISSYTRLFLVVLILVKPREAFEAPLLTMLITTSNWTFPARTTELSDVSYNLPGNILKSS